MFYFYRKIKCVKYAKYNSNIEEVAEECLILQYRMVVTNRLIWVRKKNSNFTLALSWLIELGITMQKNFWIASSLDYTRSQLHLMSHARYYCWPTVQHGHSVAENSLTLVIKMISISKRVTSSRSSD